MDREEVQAGIREWWLFNCTKPTLSNMFGALFETTSVLLQADETQDVLHLNYTSWPDHGVPTVNAIESILQFVLIVRQQANRTRDPIVVHCRSEWGGTVQTLISPDNRPSLIRVCVCVCVFSAGVGRTGTFIALDRLMQHIREHEFVDILGMVSEMRSHRLSMVQTEVTTRFLPP